MKKLLLAIALICLSAPAFAQQCTTHDKVPKLLSEGKYKEFSVATGVTNGGYLFEIYLNEESGSFTAIMTSTDKTSCITAVGHGFQIKTDEQRARDNIKRLPQF